MCVAVYAYTYIHVNIHVYIWIYMHMYIYTCVYVYIYICIICIYIYIRQMWVAECCYVLWRSAPTKDAFCNVLWCECVVVVVLLNMIQKCTLEKRVWQCVVVWCGVLQCVTVCCEVLQYNETQRGAKLILIIYYQEMHSRLALVACSHRSSGCVVVCCSVFQCVAVCCSTVARSHRSSGCVVVFCSVFQCVAICFSMLPCDTMCCAPMGGASEEDPCITYTLCRYLCSQVCTLYIGCNNGGGCQYFSKINILFFFPVFSPTRVGF